MALRRVLAIVAIEDGLDLMPDASLLSQPKEREPMFPRHMSIACPIAEIAWIHSKRSRKFDL